MRILFITTLSHSQWGGSEELWIRTAFQALKSGVQADILVYNWGNLHPRLVELSSAGAYLYFRYTNYKTRKILPRIINRIFGKRRSNRQFKFLFHRRRPDFIVISQGGTFDLGYPNQHWLSEFLIQINTPYLVICQNNADTGYVPGKEIREVIAKVFGKAKEVLFVSKRNLDVAERQLYSNIERGNTIWNPVNLKQVQIQQWNHSEIAEFAVVAALKCSHKGQDLLFEVLSSKKWINRSWILNLYGMGEDAEYLKELASFYQMKDRVVFHGYVEDIHQIWHQNHILLLPSLGEGMPLALQEAMLCGRCAVATDVAGNSELVIDGKTGFLAEAPTVKLFDKVLEKAWGSKGKWKQMGENAFLLAKEKVDLTPEITLFNKFQF